LISYLNHGEQEARVDVLGMPVDCLTMEQATSQVCHAWQGDKVFHVVTANAEMIYTSMHDPELAEIIRSAQLVTADGAGVVKASRLLGCPAPERVAGYDLMLKCLEKAARNNAPVYLLGAHPDVLNQARQRAEKLFPGLSVAGARDGYFKEEEQKQILEEICACGPALLLVAMGVPRQEKWIYEHKEKLPPCAVIGVGGSFDVLAGKSRRAPLWMQRAGLEWLYRVYREPRRLIRVRILPLFLAWVLLQAAGLKRF